MLRRMRALLLLLSVSLASTEVLWGDDVAPASARSAAATAVASVLDADLADDACDACACLCACGCAGAQACEPRDLLRPASDPVSPAPAGLPAEQRVAAVPPDPDLRPPAA